MPFYSQITNSLKARLFQLVSVLFMQMLFITGAQATALINIQFVFDRDEDRHWPKGFAQYHAHDLKVANYFIARLNGAFSESKVDMVARTVTPLYIDSFSSFANRTGGFENYSARDILNAYANGDMGLGATNYHADYVVIVPRLEVRLFSSESWGTYGDGLECSAFMAPPKTPDEIRQKRLARKNAMVFSDRCLSGQSYNADRFIKTLGHLMGLAESNHGQCQPQYHHNTPFKLGMTDYACGLDTTVMGRTGVALFSNPNVSHVNCGSNGQPTPCGSESQNAVRLLNENRYEYSGGRTIAQGTRDVALKAINGRYAVAESGGNDTVNANRSVIGPWERFKLTPRYNGTVALKATGNWFVRSEHGGGADVRADRRHMYGHEEYNLVPVWGQKQGFLTYNNHYLGQYGGNQLRAHHNTINAFNNQEQAWEIIKLDAVWRRVERTFKYVDVGPDGDAWGITTDNQIWRLENGKSNWEKITGSLVQVSVGPSDTHVWGVNAHGMVYKWRGMPKDKSQSNWEYIGGLKLKQVSVGEDGKTWGVGFDGAIYRRDLNHWTRIPGALKQISVGSDRVVWGVNSSNYIYRWKGHTWERMPGEIRQIDAAANGEVRGLTGNGGGGVWRFDTHANRWYLINGSINHVSIGKYGNLWSIAGNNSVWRSD